MKRFLVSVTLLISTHAFSQQNYWQQQVNHRIEVTLNDKEHSLKGFETIEYINNAPEQLNFIWFHLWPNAYKDKTTAYARQIIKEKGGDKKLNNLKEKGYIDSLNFSVDGVKAAIETDPSNIDLVKVILPKPLPPGGKVMISTPFYVKLPSYISRSGHIGQSYMICQWYPKPAVYDSKGWHPLPYLDQGEFYNEFGNYEVSITLPSPYIVGATGNLDIEEELQQYKTIGKSNVSTGAKKNTVKYKAPASPVKTLLYKAENVTDFAWFADKNFVVRYDTLLLENQSIDVFAFHHPDGNEYWVKSTDFLKSNIRKYSEYLGNYAYPIVQAVEGPKNESSGGMEYPTITLITKPDATSDDLESVLAHEVGHNWLAIMLASNERKYAWLDEGINTYYQFRYEAEVNKTNTVFGASLPAELKQKPTREFQALIYNALNKIPLEGAIDIPSADFADKDAYGMITYLKTAIWMYYIELNVGKENLDRAMKAYFNQWKFKHPQPQDLKAVMEKELRMNMTPYFELLNKKANF